MPSSSNTSPKSPKTNAAIRVLVVDDDVFQLEVIADLLRGLGVWDITTAASGELAMQAVAKASGPMGFNLMLSDLQMPGMDGFLFMEALARTGFSGAFIIVSGQRSEVLHSASLVAQLRRFKWIGSLEKPVDRSGLSALLDKVTA